MEVKLCGHGFAFYIDRLPGKVVDLALLCPFGSTYTMG
jgi:hypothetical protein